MKWYVFDKHDCFGSFKSGEAALVHAQWMIDGGSKGVEIKYMSLEACQQYCQDGRVTVDN
jgi:hypothetical protein